MNDSNMARLKDMLLTLKRQRVMADKLKNDISTTQTEALPLLSFVDPDRTGVAFEFGDERLAGYYVQNATPDVMDTAGLVEYLKRIGKWEIVSTQVLDQKKLQAEIAAGNIRASQVNKFLTPGTAPAPYIRFAKPKKNSI